MGTGEFRRTRALQPQRSRVASSTNHCRWIIAMTGCGLAWLLFCTGATAQSELDEPPTATSSTQRLLMEQAEQLASANQVDEAVGSLERLYDQAADTVVAAGTPQRASTLIVQRYEPLHRWVGRKVLNVLAQDPEHLLSYRRRVDAQAAMVFKTQQQEKNLRAISLASSRFRASTWSAKLELLATDICLEYGWSLAGLQALTRAAPSLRFDLSEIEVDSRDYRPSGSLSWPLVYAQQNENVGREFQSWIERLDEPGTPAANASNGVITRVDFSSRVSFSEALRRYAIAAAQQSELVGGAAIKSWLTSVIEDGMIEQLSQSDRQGLQRILNRVRADQSTDTALSSLRLPQAERLGEWPGWSQELPRVTATADQTQASKPRVAEMERGALPYLPAVYEDKLIVHELTRIMAYELASGSVWPDARAGRALYDSRTSPAAYMPLGYPLMGIPRAMVSIEGDCVYARMGDPITGRVNQQADRETRSQSYLVGLDLQKQGSMLRGFALHLDAPEFEAAEFDGPPLAWGDYLFVAVVQRDSVGLRRSVAAFDRHDGQLLWKSSALASDSVAGAERANLICNQLLTMAGGRLYYNTNLGAIVCLDPLDGSIQWLTQYTQPNREREAFPKPNRFRYRNLNPCLVSGGLVFCLPSDCPELFALDALTGDLVWSTDDVQVADAVHILGAHNDTLVVSGDRVVWLEQFTGRVLGRFPGSTTPGLVNALPDPRGLGRGTVLGDQVLFPVADEILVLPATLPQGNQTIGGMIPQVLGRIPLGSRGREGGNLLAHDNWLFYSSPSRVLGFARD